MVFPLVGVAVIMLLGVYDAKLATKSCRSSVTIDIFAQSEAVVEYTLSDRLRSRSYSVSYLVRLPEAVEDPSYAAGLGAEPEP